MSQKPLTPQVQRFVQALAEIGSVEEAAIIAGYSRKSARVTGWRLQRRPHVAAAIRAAREEKWGELTPKALGVIKKRLDDDSEPAQQLRAALHVADRYFGPIASEHRVEHTLRVDALDYEAQQRRMTELAEQIAPFLRARDIQSPALHAPNGSNLPISADYSDVSASGATTGPQTTPQTASRAAEDARHNPPPEGQS